jgi:putative aldouronate transport system substrate-binding protein
VTDISQGAATNRRHFLALMGLGATAAAGGTGLLAGCSNTTSGDSGKAASVDKLTALVPTYVPFKVGAPDLPGNPPGVAPGYLKYPSSLVRAVTEAPIKSGKEVSAMTPLWNPLPPGLGSNSYFDAVNRRLGGAVRINILDGITYGDKLNPVLAAGDVPEMMQIPGWIINDNLAHFSDAVQKLFADLTPFLQGDKAKAYPLLANLPTDAWKFAVWNDKLHAVPLPNSPYTHILFYRKDIFDRLSVAPPTSADELLALGKKINDPKSNRWAFGNIFEEMNRAFGTPGLWRKQADGTLIHKIESDEFARSVEFTAGLFKAGMVHPSVVENKNTDEKQLFASGQILLFKDGVGAWHEILQQQQSSNPAFQMAAVKVFSATGGTPLVWRGDPATMYVFIKKGLSDARVQELLGVSNFCSAPFGTEEFELQTYGERNKHFTFNSAGLPQFTPLGTKEASAPTYYFLGGHNDAITESFLPNYVQGLHDWETEASQHLENHPFQGIRIERPSNFSSIATPTDDKVQDILRGKRPVSDLKQVIQEWRDGGGEEGRTFYTNVMKQYGR